MSEDYELFAGLPSHQMVVKVQRPLAQSTPGLGAYLVTDEDQELYYQIPVGVIPDLDTAMCFRERLYLGASIVEVQGRYLLALNPHEPIEGLDW